MKRRTYCSPSTYDLSPEELISLLELAREENQATGLTGMLLYTSQSFLQMLEGVPVALGETYEQIVDDKLEGFTSDIGYPLVNPDLITIGGVAQILLTLHAKNRVS